MDSPPEMDERAFYAAAYVEQTDYLFIHGGHSPDIDFLKDLWMIDTNLPGRN